MTKAPDCIWATGEAGFCSRWNDHPEDGYHSHVKYLLATPAREAAEELLELLKGTPDCIEDLADNHPNNTSAHHLQEFAQSIRAAIAKAKGE